MRQNSFVIEELSEPGLVDLTVLVELLWVGAGRFGTRPVLGSLLFTRTLLVSRIVFL